ncbi:MAG: hypothetical protein Q9227_005522 [Pyrenula ochraceoflavens]
MLVSTLGAVALALSTSVAADYSGPTTLITSVTPGSASDSTSRYINARSEADATGVSLNARSTDTKNGYVNARSEAAATTRYVNTRSDSPAESNTPPSDGTAYSSPTSRSQYPHETAGHPHPTAGDPCPYGMKGQGQARSTDGQSHHGLLDPHRMTATASMKIIEVGASETTTTTLLVPGTTAEIVSTLTVNFTGKHAPSMRSYPWSILNNTATGTQKLVEIAPTGTKTFTVTGPALTAVNYPAATLQVSNITTPQGALGAHEDEESGARSIA